MRSFYNQALFDPFNGDVYSISGSSLQKAGSFLGAAALVGLLGTTTSNSLNLVSAPALAKKLGVKVRFYSDIGKT